MPICADPDASYLVELPSDEKRPEDQRTKFRFRFLTRKQERRVEELIEAAVAETNRAKCEALINEALLVGLVGTIEEIDEKLTWREKGELAHFYRHAGTLAEREKNSLGSDAPSDGDSSAENAEQPAQTSQA